MIEKKIKNNQSKISKRVFRGLRFEPVPCSKKKLATETTENFDCNQHRYD